MGFIAGLQTSLSGMKVAQSQLEVISRNVANADTVGYSRKIGNQKNLVLAGTSVGVTFNGTTRAFDEGLLKSYLSSNTSSGALSAKTDYFAKAEILLGTPQSDNSIAANVSNLQKYFDTFATDVTSSAGRYSLLTAADTVTSRLNSISSEIQKLRGDADMEIRDSVESINKLLDQLDELNDKIVKYNVLGYDGTADLEDQRDAALRELSEYIDITYFKRDNGAIVIQTSGGETLLDKDPHYLSHSAIAQASASSTYAGGSIGGIYLDGEDITSKIRDGKIKGLIEVRDESLPSLQSQLDELAGVLKEQINNVHNQGTAYPNTPSTLTGTREFIDTANQSIRLDQGDVRFIIFDQNGNQVATDTLRGRINFTEGTLDEMAAQIQTWLNDANGGNLPQATVSFDDKGQLVIDTGDSNYSVSIMDEALSTPGSTQQNAVISFDGNADGSYDRTFEGFSSFFGLNDFFDSNSNDSIYDSKVLSKNANLGVKNTITLSFSDQNHGLNFGNIEIYPNDSLQSIVDKINSNPDINENIRASLVPNGDGFMLRIEDVTGSQLEISETTVPQSGFMERIGLDVSNCGMAGSLSVREDLKVSPEQIAGGTPEFNPTSGKYEQNPATNNIANAMSKVFSDTQTFAQSGSIAKTDTTLANYASTFVGNIASQALSYDEALTYQQTLTSSIATKEAQISGVDVDQELSQMIIFQQTYAACAKAFTASKEIMDMLLDIV
ncbi:MAG: flagellar hook-associated protein FlgK [Alphaproteobacteria bacterium]|nr:flagellar hook-associated protein FlgK [Alphaproteobacteria bacterium]